MKFFWGLVLSSVGVVLLGSNLAWWSVDIGRLFFYLWPLIFIIFGLRFLVDNDKVFMFLTLIIVLLSGYAVAKTPGKIYKKLENSLEYRIFN